MPDDDAEDRAQHTAADDRARLGAVIQDVAVEFSDGDDTRRGVVVGWMVVAEVLAPDGERWLTKYGGSAANDRIPSWQEHGYAHAVLHDWPTPDDDDDDEGDA